MTSKMVYLFMNGVKFEYNEEYPALSRVYFDIGTFKTVEALKKFSFKSIIMSPYLKISESRGRDVIKYIFDKLNDKDEGRRFLPEDWRSVYHSNASSKWKARTISDFVSSMTDRYCLEFYSRLIGSSPPSIYKPPY